MEYAVQYKGTNWPRQKDRDIDSNRLTGRQSEKVGHTIKLRMPWTIMNILWVFSLISARPLIL